MSKCRISLNLGITLKPIHQFTVVLFSLLESKDNCFTFTFNRFYVSLLSFHPADSTGA